MGQRCKQWISCVGLILTMLWSGAIATSSPTIAGAEVRLATIPTQPHDPGSHTG